MYVLLIAILSVVQSCSFRIETLFMNRKFDQVYAKVNKLDFRNDKSTIIKLLLK